MKLVMQTHSELLSVGPNREDRFVAHVPYPTDIFFNYAELDPLCDLLHEKNITSHQVSAGITSVHGLTKTRYAANYAYNKGHSLVIQAVPKSLNAIYAGVVGLARVIGWPIGLERPEIVTEVAAGPEEWQLLHMSTPLASLFTADRPVQTVVLRSRRGN